MIVRSTNGIETLITQLRKSLYIAYDLETTGLNPRKNSIIGIAIATEDSAFYVVLQEFVNNQLTEVLPKSAVSPLLAELRRKRLLMHNASFDCRFTQCQLGVDLTTALYADTMLLQHTLNENLFSYGLKDLGASYFGSEAANEKVELLESIKANGGSKTEYYKASTDIMAKYACQDVRLTYKLWKLLDPQLDADGLRNFFYKDEVMPLYKTVTIQMEQRGVPVDVVALQDSQTEIAADIAALEASIQAAIAPLLNGFNDWYIRTKYPYKLSGPFKEALAARVATTGWPKSDSGAYSFNKAEIAKAIKKGHLAANTQLERYITGADLVPNDLIREIQVQLATAETGAYLFNLSSKDHLKRLFFGSSTTESLLKETALSNTPTGAPQVDDAFLDVMAKKYAWAEDLRTFNRLNKIKSTYIDRFLDAQEDGIFYPSFQQHRTVSGRYSGDTQQLPRPLGEDEEPLEVIRKYNNRIRAFFVSAPDWSFADFDYDSQEVKVFAHVSEEQSIKDVFAKGGDFYSSVCIAATGITGYSANKKADNYLGKLNKPARQAAKAYALGLAFNMSPYTLKFELNCSENEALQIYNNYFKAYPHLKQWLDSSLKYALEHGEIKTQAGRVRRFPGLVEDYKKYGDCLFNGLELWKKYNEAPTTYSWVKQVSKKCKNYLNNAANVQIQGLASSITNRAAIKTAKALKECGLQAYLCNVVHDQLTVHCPDTELEEVCKILEYCMETAYEISVPLTAPPSWGKNWAESK
jgi:DNA polymerase I-like protein with 3'-5' exonuclease and polymerase domains